MGKNYDVLHYIRKQVSQYSNDNNLYNILARCFQNVESNREPDGCLSNSVALYIGLKEYGYEPQLCYGLCYINDSPFYHAWIELNNLVIDISIYGNINYNPYSPSRQEVAYPIILEAYNTCYAEYKKFCFDSDWKYAKISRLENESLTGYINKAPNQGMYKLIAKIMGELPLQTAKQIVDKHGSVHISDFRKNYEKARG